MKTKYYALTALVIFVDHLTKWLVRSRMDYREVVEIVPDYLRLSYIRNSGVAFGLFADIESAWKPYILAAMAVLAVIVIVIYAARMPSSRLLLQVALALTMGGILGNFVDRIMHGSVVDFIELHIGESFHWPTFNVADSAITVGIALLLIDTLKNPESEQDLPQAGSPEPGAGISPS
jgi:signal peptidase II